jgi:hypothetical protein
MEERWYTADLQSAVVARHFTSGPCSPFAPDPHTGHRRPGRAYDAGCGWVIFDSVALATLGALPWHKDFHVPPDREPLLIHLGLDTYPVLCAVAPEWALAGAHT